MKRIIAGILALSMMFSFAACGDSSSTSDSSKASTSSSAADSSETNGQSESQAETSAVTEESSAAQTQSTEAPKTGEITTFEQSYTYKFQQLSASKSYSIEMSMDYMGMKVPLKFEINKKNFHMVMDMTQFGGEANTETYYIDGKTYALLPSNKMYSLTEGEVNNQFADSADLSPNGDIQFISSTEENGMIVEKLKVTTDNPSGGKVTSDATYYYDKASGEPKKVVAAVNGMTSTIEITSFKVGEQNIVLPDLSGWTRVDANPNAGINAGTAGAAAANQ